MIPTTDAMARAVRTSFQVAVTSLIAVVSAKLGALDIAGIKSVADVVKDAKLVTDAVLVAAPAVGAGFVSRIWFAIFPPKPPADPSF